MERVAHSLQTIAIERVSDALDFDLFGRSAFNRYYYALYLTVRELLNQLDSKWAEQPHAGIPELLKGKVLEGLKKRRARAERLGDGEAIRLASQAGSQVLDLAATMTRANSVRVTADYNPSVPITRGISDRFSLGATDITEAHDWSGRGRHAARVILRAWRLPE